MAVSDSPPRLSVTRLGSIDCVRLIFWRFFEQSHATVGTAERGCPPLLPPLALFPAAAPSSVRMRSGTAGNIRFRRSAIPSGCGIRFRPSRPFVLSHDGLAYAHPEDAAPGARLCRPGVSLRSTSIRTSAGNSRPLRCSIKSIGWRNWKTNLRAAYPASAGAGVSDRLLTDDEEDDHRRGRAADPARACQCHPDPELSACGWEWRAGSASSRDFRLFTIATICSPDSRTSAVTCLPPRPSCCARPTWCSSPRRGCWNAIAT